MFRATDHRVGDLAVQRADNLLRVDLAGGAVPPPVMRRRDAGVGQPLLGVPGAEQHAGHGRARRPCVVRRQQRQLGERRLGIRRALGAQERAPKRLVQRSEARIRNGLFVEPAKARLPPPLRQTQPLVVRHPALRGAHPDVASAGAVMLRIACRDFEQQHPFALREHPVPGVNADGRIDGIGADFDQQGVQRDDLLPRHTLRLPVVGDAAEQHAAARVGERRDLVRPGVPARADRTVSGELDLLELPGAVLAHLELTEDVLGAVTHCLSPWRAPATTTYPAAPAAC